MLTRISGKTITPSVRKRRDPPVTVMLAVDPVVFPEEVVPLVPVVLPVPDPVPVFDLRVASVPLAVLVPLATAVSTPGVTFPATPSWLAMVAESATAVAWEEPAPRVEVVVTVTTGSAADAEVSP